MTDANETMFFCPLCGFSKPHGAEPAHSREHCLERQVTQLTAALRESSLQVDHAHAGSREAWALVVKHEKAVEQLRSVNDDLRHGIDRMQGEVDDMLSEKEQCDQIYKMVVMGTCPQDEQHCACVPWLYARLAYLQGPIDGQGASYRALQVLETDPMFTAITENARLQETIRKAQGAWVVLHNHCTPGNIRWVVDSATKDQLLAAHNALDEALEMDAYLEEEDGRSTCDSAEPGTGSPAAGTGDEDERG